MSVVTVSGVRFRVFILGVFTIKSLKTGVGPNKTSLSLPSLFPRIEFFRQGKRHKRLN